MPGLKLPGNGRRLPASLLKREDAELNDIAFVTPETGFAVGDHGLILRTTNGGRNWQPVYSGVTDRLESVHFIDPNIGWAAGGSSLPYTHRSQGVVLTTRDGGLSWKKVNRLEIPAIKKIRFFNGRNGWAVGDASALHQTGMLRTRDGGVTWVAIPGPGRPQWTTAAFQHFDQGMVAGRGGLLASVTRSGARASAAPALGLRQPRCMQLATPRDGWLAGDGGMLLRTADAGVSWTKAGNLPEGVEGEFDFKSVAVAGNHVWVAGSPGSCVLHSADAGMTWKLHPTGNTTPIRAMTFLDENNGWAVGSLGAILSTRDGGRNWSLRRRGGTRAAMLAILSAGDALNMPFELFAKYCAAEGYLGVLQCVGGPLPGSAADQSDEAAFADRLHAAALAAGASRGVLMEAFPAASTHDSARTIEDLWNRIHRGEGVSALEEALVRSIRQWRPPVVLLQQPAQPEANGRSSENLTSLLHRVAVSAVSKAADPSQYPAQLNAGGLSTWTTKKVYLALPPGQRGAITVNAVTLLPGLGKSIGDYANAARGLVLDSPRYGPDSIAVQLASTRIAASSGRDNMFGGIPLQAGEGARRKSASTTLKTIETMHLTAQKKRNIRQMLIRRKHSGVQNSWLTQLRNSISGLPPEEACPILFDYAASAAQRGEVADAAETHENILLRHPEHALSDASAQWLIRYYTSGENAWRFRETTRGATARSLTDVDPVQKAGHIEQVATAASQAATLKFGAPVIANQGTVDRAKYLKGHRELLAKGATAYAAGIEQLNRQQLTAGDGLETGNGGVDASWRPRGAAFISTIQRTRPGLAIQPATQFALSAMTRSQATGAAAIRPYQRQKNAGGETRWLIHAGNELSLVDPQSAGKASAWKCGLTDKRPYLDGKLDDVVWQTPVAISLTGAADPYRRWPADIKSAYDNDYLYLAVTCRKTPQAAYPDAPGGRPRDADLAGHDRVTILLDMDRDYSTSYAFTVDHRGWSTEACCGDTSWNPKWHIASSATASEWTAEVAIPWNELTGQPPTSGVHWAAAAVRTVPGAGSQSWQGTATSRLDLATYGLLKFE